jgi:hypothetical protein
MQIGEPVNIMKLVPFAVAKYEDLSLATLTAYSVYWLTQWGLPTTLENVAVLNFKLFPTKFAMTGWAQFPDVNRTNRSVLQMRPKYRNFATSITNQGIFLNGRGIEEAQALINRLGAPALADGSSPDVEVPIARVRGSGRPTTVHNEDLVAKVRKSRLFQSYREGRWNEVEAIDLINFLEVYDHTPGEEKRRRLKTFQSAAKDLKDDDVVQFLENVTSRFRVYLNR